MKLFKKQDIIKKSLRCAMSWCESRPAKPGDGGRKFSSGDKACIVGRCFMASPFSIYKPMPNQIVGIQKKEVIMKKTIESIKSAKMEIWTERTIIAMDRDYYARLGLRIHAWTTFKSEYHRVNIEYRLESGAVLWSKNEMIFDTETGTFSPFEEWTLIDEATNIKVGKFPNQQTMTRYVKRQLCR